MDKEIDNFDYEDEKSINHGIGDLFGSVEWKLVIVLILICVIIFSDVFVSAVLNKVEGTTNGIIVTNKGKFIQSVALVGGYITASMLNYMRIL